MRNPNCPVCGKILDTFADDYYCSNCKIKIDHNNLTANIPNINKDNVRLLSCKNAFLTNKEFHHGDNCWKISNMAMAIVHDNGSLAIQFNDGVTKEFRLSADNSTIASAAGLALFGGIGTIIAGNVAINNQIKAKSQQWATTINMLISKVKLPEMIYCKYCGTKNKSTQPKCINCGAIMQ